MHLTSHITHSNGYAPCIAYYRSKGVDQLFRKLKPKPKLNPPNAHRSPIKICEKWHTHNVQFLFMPNAFRILKPNAFAKNQMRLAYEDKRDLYCITFIPGNQLKILARGLWVISEAWWDMFLGKLMLVWHFNSNILYIQTCYYVSRTINACVIM